MYCWFCSLSYVLRCRGFYYSIVVVGFATCRLYVSVPVVIFSSLFLCLSYVFVILFVFGVRHAFKVVRVCHICFTCIVCFLFVLPLSFPSLPVCPVFPILRLFGLFLDLFCCLFSRGLEIWISEVAPRTYTYICIYIYVYEAPRASPLFSKAPS